MSSVKVRTGFVLLTSVHLVSTFVLVYGRCSINVVCCQMTVIHRKPDLENFLLIGVYRQMVKTVLSLDSDFNSSSIMI